MTISNDKKKPASPITRDKLLADINAYCESRRISSSDFGRLVFNDSSFYGRVQRGRSPTLDRIEAVYDYISENPVRSDIDDLIG